MSKSGSQMDRTAEKKKAVVLVDKYKREREKRAKQSIPKTYLTIQLPNLE